MKPAKSKKKKSARQLAAESIRKPVPPPGHAHPTDKDYVRKPKHKKDLIEESDL